MIGQEVVERWLRLRKQLGVGVGKGGGGGAVEVEMVVRGVCWTTA